MGRAVLYGAACACCWHCSLCVLYVERRTPYIACRLSSVDCRVSCLRSGPPYN